MKILVFGDSIGWGKWDPAGGWVARLRTYIDEIYNLVTPSQNVQVYNQCIPGELLWRLPQRMEYELQARMLADGSEESIVIVAAGVNDVHPGNRLRGQQSTQQEFLDGVQSCIAIAQSYGCKVLVLGLLPIAENDHWTQQGFTNAEISKYRGYMHEYAQQQGVTYLDIAAKIDLGSYVDALVDGIHPHAGGHAVITHELVSYLRDQLGWIG